MSDRPMTLAEWTPRDPDSEWRPDPHASAKAWHDAMSRPLTLSPVQAQQAAAGITPARPGDVIDLRRPAAPAPEPPAPLPTAVLQELRARMSPDELRASYEAERAAAGGGAQPQQPPPQWAHERLAQALYGKR